MTKQISPLHQAHLARLHQVVYVIMNAAPVIYDQIKIKVPKNISILTGRVYVQELLCGHPVTFFELMRMRKDVFLLLCDKLKQTGLEDTKYMGIEEMVSIFMYIVGHKTTQRLAENRLQRSKATINT